MPLLSRCKQPFGRPHLRLIALVGVIVPRRLRADWRQEWEAELSHREEMLAEWDRLDPRSKLHLLWRSTSAFWDALWLQTYRWEDAMIQDLRYGVRMLLKQPGFSFIAVLTLALGIGANTIIFSAMESVILHPFSFPSPSEIVGVVANTVNNDLDNPAEPGVYQAFAQSPAGSMEVIVRGLPNQTEHENVSQAVGALRQGLAAVDASLPFVGSTTLQDAIRERISTKRFITVMLGVFAVLALVMATVGLYAVMSFGVAQRTHELGIRMALGAQTRGGFVIVVMQGLRLASLGVTIGLIGAFAVTRLLSQMLYGVTATDPITFSMVAGLPLAIAFVACLVPARRATRIDPLVALRHE